MNSLTNLYLFKWLLSFFKCRQSQVGGKVLDFVHLPQTCSVPYASIVGRSSPLSIRVHPRGRMVLERSWSKRVIVQGDLSICYQLEKEKSSQESSSFFCLGRKDWVHCLGVDDGLRVHQQAKVSTPDVQQGPEQERWTRKLQVQTRVGCCFLVVGCVQAQLLKNAGPSPFRDPVALFPSP